MEKTQNTLSIKRDIISRTISKYNKVFENKFSKRLDLESRYQSVPRQKVQKAHYEQCSEMKIGHGYITGKAHILDFED